MSKTSDKFRIEWLAADKARDAGLEEPTDVAAFKDIPYGPAGHWNLLDLYVPKAAAETSFLKGLFRSSTNPGNFFWRTAHDGFELHLP